VKAGYVYIIASGRNGTLYIGVTSDLVKRVWEHRNGFHQEARMQDARLVRGLRRYSGRASSRAADEEMEANLEAQRHRADESRLGGFIPDAAVNPVSAPAEAEAQTREAVFSLALPARTEPLPSQGNGYFAAIKSGSSGSTFHVRFGRFGTI
jgi:predicted GIY-YIG superfamily endonuclease